MVQGRPSATSSRRPLNLLDRPPKSPFETKSLSTKIKQFHFFFGGGGVPGGVAVIETCRAPTERAYIVIGAIDIVVRDSESESS